MIDFIGKVTSVMEVYGGRTDHVFSEGACLGNASQRYFERWVKFWTKEIKGEKMPLKLLGRICRGSNGMRYFLKSEG